MGNEAKNSAEILLIVCLFTKISAYVLEILTIENRKTFCYDYINENVFSNYKSSEGRPMLTIRDVARIANVSISTVSRVMNNTAPVEEETRQRVIDAVRRTGYKANTIAKALKSGRTNTIAFVIPNLENMIYPSLATAVENEAQKYGYFVLFCNTQENQAKAEGYIEKLKRDFVDGFLFSTALAGDESTEIQKLREEGVPTVCLMRETGDPRDSVVSANLEGGYLATKYLLERGFREIAAVCGRHNMALYEQRLAGYKKALEEFNIPFDPLLCLQGVKDGQENGSECILSYHKQYGRIPESIFALSDPLAFDVMITLNRLGYSIPHDVSVIGFDNVPFAENYYLTTVEQKLYEMARAATRQLIAIIEKREMPNQPQQVFPVRVVERQSVRFADGKEKMK